MKPGSIFKNVGNLEFIARTSGDTTQAGSLVQGLIRKDGIFEGVVVLSQGYHVTSPCPKQVEPPCSWWQVKCAMERHSTNWKVLRERTRGEASTRGYTVEVK